MTVCFIALFQLLVLMFLYIYDKGYGYYLADKGIMETSDTMFMEDWNCPYGLGQGTWSHISANIWKDMGEIKNKYL